MASRSSSSSKIHIATSFVFIFVKLLCNLDLSHGNSLNSVMDSPLLTKRIGTNRSIIVDINGDGDFKSIQAAIDAIPNGNSKWIIIDVRKGIYEEKVEIPGNKPYIFMRGSGKGKTAIVWSQSSRDNVESATLKVRAPNFVAFGIRFKNDAPTGIAHTSHNQSVAAVVGADKVAFYHCAFFSTHNTLFDYKGRHYYDNCYIQGSVDFIFGRGQSIFHNCEMFVIGDKRVNIHGSITAHRRDKAKEKTGFVFQNGHVYGIGRHVYLGRAKGAFSRVIFANTYISKTIEPQAWTNWSYSGTTKNIYHAEYRCHGPGSNSTNRAPWSKQLSEKEAAPYLSLDFINGKQWLPAWFSS